MEEYKRCTRCVMDNKSDETITFDKHGRCNYCTDALNLIGKVYFPNAEGEQKLRQMIEISYHIRYNGISSESFGSCNGGRMAWTMESIGRSASGDYGK